VPNHRGQHRQRDLVDRARKRDQEAFGLLYDAYLPRLYRYCLSRVGNETDAEDLAEEIFLKVLGAIDGFQWQPAPRLDGAASADSDSEDARVGSGEGRIPFGAWLFRIAHNHVVSFHRRAATRGPVSELSEDDIAKLLRMEDELHRRIIGQEQAVKALSKSIRRTRAGLKDPKRPSGSFIFAGPSGVGKTELSKTLAEFLFGDEDALIALDMSEFSERHTASRLFGSPPGYVGYEEGGQLTEKVRRKPFSVVLFDEVEKAHPDIFNSLLQVLEEGRLTDAQGRVVDFKNTVIIMTTNLGSRDVSKGVLLGFAPEGDTENAYERMKAKVQQELKQHFRPEFLNRIDDVIVFHQLSAEEISQIVELMIAGVETRLQDRNMAIELTPAAKGLLAERGYDPLLGARPLRRTIQRELEDPLSEKILFGEVKPGEIVVVDVTGEGMGREFVFRGEPKAALPDVPPAVDLAKSEE